MHYMTISENEKKVCVIGARPSGIIAIKTQIRKAKPIQKVA